jgi:hypothetical protein
LLLHKIQLVDNLSEVIAGLGGLPEGKAVGVEVIGHVTLTSTCLVNIALRPAPRCKQPAFPISAARAISRRCVDGSESRVA